MDQWHPDHTALEKFLNGQLAEPDSRSLERHLFTCRVCEEQLLQLLPEPEDEPEPGDDSSRVIRQVLDDASMEIGDRTALLKEERREARRLWQELQNLTPGQRLRRTAAQPQFHTWGLFELLIEKSRQPAGEDPVRAEEQLRLAIALSDHLDPVRYGHGSVEAAKARGWAYLGNSLRLLSDFRKAEQAFQMAELYFSQSWHDPLDEGLILELKASLRRAQRRLDESVHLLEDAIGLYRELNEVHLQGRSLMCKGLVLQHKGDITGAAVCFRNSLFLLDRNEEPRLVVVSQFNLINCLFDSGQAAEAAALIPEARHLLEKSGTRADLLHLRWLEAEVGAALGQTAEAEQAFLEAKEAFSEARLAFDAALVSLGLAALYARQGRTADVKRLAEEIIPIFRSCEVPQEALAALIVFQKAAEREQLTLGLVEEVTDFLERVRTNPGLRFREAD